MADVMHCFESVVILQNVINYWYVLFWYCELWLCWRYWV